MCRGEHIRGTCAHAMKLHLQSQSTECAIACLAMICSKYGANYEIAELRRKCAIGQKGTTLHQLVNYASLLGFSSRPLSLRLDEVGELSLPCILHWNMNHFVVLKKVSSAGEFFHILDPAVGERVISREQLSKCFTGVALEMSPGPTFSKIEKPARTSLKELARGYAGLRSGLTMILLMSLALEAFSLGAPLLNQLVVDDVLGAGDGDLLFVLMIGFGLLLIIQSIIGFFRGWMSMVMAQSVAIQWTGNVFSHLIRLPLDYFERRHLGDIVSRFGSVSALQKVLTTGAIEALIDGLLAIGTLGMMLWYSPLLSVITLLAVGCYGTMRAIFYMPFRIASTERIQLAAKESSHFLESIRAMAPLKLFGREAEREARWRNLMVDVQNRDIQTAKLGVIYSGTKTLILGLENLAVLWLGANMVIKAQGEGGGAWTIGMLLAYISYKTQFSGRVVSLISFFIDLKMLGMHTERLADVTNEPQEALGNVAANLEGLESSLELRNVSFRYAEGEPWILRAVNLTITPGEIVALTGPSGAGKTTLLKIALGLLIPTEGEVRYGGVPIGQLGLRNYRSMVGTVLQEDSLLTGSIEENIAFFDLQVDPHKVAECARAASIHDEIVRMPMGYHTLIGDLGTGVSGGQKQRLLLARALYKRPTVLALDEATSHLDSENERAVNLGIRERRLTTLVIAHRMETVNSSDRVIHLEYGQVSSNIGTRRPLLNESRLLSSSSQQGAIAV